MARHPKELTTDEEIDRALKAARKEPPVPLAVDVQYLDGENFDVFVLKLQDGRLHLLQRKDLQGLQHATKKQLKNIEIIMGGSGLSWPDLEADHYVPALLENVFGNREWMAKIGTAAAHHGRPAKFAPLGRTVRSAGGLERSRLGRRTG
jgi:hypothetical protein